MTQKRPLRDVPLDRNVVAFAGSGFRVVAIHRVEDLSSSTSPAEVFVTLAIKPEAVTTLVLPAGFAFLCTSAALEATITRRCTSACLFAGDVFAPTPASRIFAAAFMTARIERGTLVEHMGLGLCKPVTVPSF